MRLHLCDGVFPVYDVRIEYKRAEYPSALGAYSPDGLLLHKQARLGVAQYAVSLDFVDCGD